MRGVSGCYFSWQARYLVHLDNVLKGSKIAFCESVVEFDSGYDNDSVWQAQDFGCLGFIFRGRRNTLSISTKVVETWIQ